MGTVLETKRYPLAPSWRLLMILLCAMGGMCSSFCYVNLSLAIVCMVNQTMATTSSAANLTNASGIPEACKQQYVEAKQDYHGTYNWDREIQAFVLSGVLWAALLIVFPAGWLVDWFGAKRIFAYTNAVNAVASGLVPVAAQAGFQWLFALRVFNGFGFGMIWPTVLKVASNWSAQQELGMVVAICSSGFQLSGLVMMGISGQLCSTIGWEYIFYFCSGVQLLWLLLFIWLFSSTPAESRFISQAELQYLKQSEVKKVARVPLTQVPWGKMLTSAPVLAVFFDTYCTWFFGSIVAFFLPTYLKEVLYVGAAKNGLYSALPSLTLLIGRNLSGYLSDRLTARFGATKSVKILNTLSGLIPAVMFSVMSLVDCRHSELAIVCVTVSYFFFAFFTGGYLKSLISIVPAYAGVLSGLNFIFGYTATITLSYVIGWLTKNHTIDEWRQALFIGVGALAAGTLVFAIFGSGEPVGDWAKSRQREEKHPIDIDDDDEAAAVVFDETF